MLVLGEGLEDDIDLVSKALFSSGCSLMLELLHGQTSALSELNRLFGHCSSLGINDDIADARILWSLHAEMAEVDAGREDGSNETRRRPDRRKDLVWLPRVCQEGRVWLWAKVRVSCRIADGF